MQTACGLIPDSGGRSRFYSMLLSCVAGTTLITGGETQRSWAAVWQPGQGPKDDIEKLYHGICLKWPRCRRMQEALQVVQRKHLTSSQMRDAQFHPVRKQSKRI